MNNETDATSVERISVIVPRNPFVRLELQNKHHCLCALDVEKLMEVANADGRVFMHYSTPREYTLARNAAQQSEGITWPLKEYSDFFPLAMPDGHSYWAGKSHR